MQAARTRARRRLIGAAVLVGVGIIGFPLLFETQPRPIAVDIPIEIPARDGVPPLSRRRAEERRAAPCRAPPRRSVAERAAEAPTEPSAAAAGATGAGLAGGRAAGAASAPQRAERARRALRPRAGQPRCRAATDSKRRCAARAGAARRQAGNADGRVAPLDGAAASEPKAARFVVQAGAYTDATALREARQKVEKLGLKTYTQVIETESGARTRVRVGPFATREEADKAAARIKGSGLAANILSL